MKHFRATTAAMILFLAVGTIQAQSAPITINDPYLQLYHVSDNTLGYLAGDLLRIGATSVTPNGSANPPTYGYGTTDLVGTSTQITRKLYFIPGAVDPNFYSRILNDYPSLYGPWTLTFINGTNQNSITVPSVPSGTTVTPFVKSITISGSGASPTFSWAAPSSTEVDGYRVNIYDTTTLNINNKPTLVFSHNYQPNVTSFNVGSQTTSLDQSHHYSIEINLLQTRDHLSTDLSNSNVAALSRVYANFTLLPTGSPQVNLPVVLSNGSYQFNMTVVAGQTYYLDPTVATGYVFKTGANDPNFASVILPALQANAYTLSYMFDGLLTTTTLYGNTLYVFPGGPLDPAGYGVSEFTVTGIDPALGLDPNNTTAFVTGLTFVGGGNFTGTQTPITSKVPEPPTLALFAFGLGGLGLFGWRRKRKATASVA